MTMAPARWEHGSELHWVDPVPADVTPPSHPWTGDHLLVGSGRDALRAVIAHGRATRGWQRLWLPTYLCQEVVAAAIATGLPCALYPDRPGDIPAPDLSRVPLQAGDAVLVVNHFGLRAPLEAPLPDRVDLVEDHTHDPWSRWAFDSTATYAIASLRKTLPVADGGALWSPAGLPLPAPPAVTTERARGASRKLAGMILKGLYLAGGAVEKDAFRALALAGEREIASGAISGATAVTTTLVNALPVATWQTVRRGNVAHLLACLAQTPHVAPVTTPPPGATPFSALLRFDTPARRDAARSRLIEQHIYPAVLWPVADAHLPGVGAADRDLADRTLSIHCDARYTRADLDRVALALEEAAG